MLPQAGAIQKIQEDVSVKTVFLQGLVASAAPMFFASIAERWKTTTVFVLNDNDEAGYFYNDLKTIAMPADGEGKVAEVLFFPSSYRRAVKYGQRDAGNEILRTEVLTRLLTTLYRFILSLSHQRYQNLLYQKSSWMNVV